MLQSNATRRTKRTNQRLARCIPSQRARRPKQLARRVATARQFRSSRRLHAESPQTDRVGPASRFPVAKLSTIDISSFFDETGAKPVSPASLKNLTPRQQDAVDRLTLALNDQGFFFVTGSPLQQVIPNLHANSSKFFESSPAIKSRCQAIDARRGWHRFQAAPGTTSEHGDNIEAYTMQTPYLTDRQLGTEYFGFSEGEEEENGTGPKLGPHGLPPGIFLDPKILAQLGPADLPIVPAPAPTTNRDSSPASPAAPRDTNKWPRGMVGAADGVSSSVDGGFEFERSYKECWDMSVATAEATLTVIALALRINPAELLSWHTLQNHTLETKYYPPPGDRLQVPRGANLVDERAVGRSTDDSNTHNDNSSLDQVRIRFPIHSDMTSITLLSQTQYNGGLMIKTRSRGWARVGPPDYSNSGSATLDGPPTQQPPPILVNIGQFLAEFSGGSCDASLHCVVNSNDLINPAAGTSPDPTPITPARSRISTVFFCIPDHHAVIRDIRDPSRPHFGEVFNQHSTVHLPPPDLDPLIPFEAGDRFPVVGM